MRTYEKHDGETYKDYCVRMYRNRQLYGLTTDVVGFLINQEFPEEKKDESAHRKNFAKYIEGFDDGYAKGLEDAESDISNISGLNSLIPKTHLDRFTELVGEYGVRKRDMQLERNELAKMYRKVTPWILLTEQYRESLLSGEIELPEFNFERIDTSGKAIIKALPADWHIGAVVDEDYNQHNFNIAVLRVDRYCQKVLEEAERENASLISMTHLGDIVEGFEMRDEQKWFCEFLINDQIKYAQKLFTRMILTLSKNYNVEIGAIYGNHDRLVGNKNKAIYKDNAMKVIMDNIKFAIELAEEQSGKKMERISFAECSEDYKYQVEDIYEYKCRWQHGHEDAKNDERKIEKYNGVDDTFYNILGFGHLHHGRVVHGNRKNMEIYCGGLMGSNDYSKSRPKSVSNASQCIIVFRDNGDILPYEVDLQNV